MMKNDKNIMQVAPSSVAFTRDLDTPYRSIVSVLNITAKAQSPALISRCQMILNLVTSTTARNFSGKKMTRRSLVTAHIALKSPKFGGT